MLIRPKEQEYRVEKVLAVARVFLASASLLAIRLDATEPATYSTLTDILLLGYVAYSLLVMLWLRASSQLSHPKIPLVLHTIDIVGPALIALFSDGPNSPLFAFLIFVLVAAGYRWGLRKTLATAAIAILVVLAEAVVLSYGSKHFRIVQGEYEINRLIVRIAYLLAMGFLVGQLAEDEKRLQAESTTIARLLAKVRPDRGIKQSLQAVLGELLHIFDADAVLLAVEEVRWHRLYIWEGRPGVESQDLKLRLFEADGLQEPICRFPLAGELVHALRPQNPAGSGLASVLALDTDGKPVKGCSGAFPDHLLWREVESVVAGSFTFSEEWSGRLFLINPKLGRSQLTKLRYLQTLVRQLGPSVAGAYMLRRLRSKAGAMERMRVSRELHDGAIQSLIATEVRMDILRRRAANNSNGLETELAEIQEILRQQIRNLRELMLETQPLNLDPRQFVEFLASIVERFRHETGICMNFITEVEEVRLPAHVLRELGWIAREALVNARKHSRARNILVSLGYKDAHCRIVIDDDGRGFDFAGRFSLKDLEKERKGPMVIKERVRNIGGELMIESVPGRGARLEILIPFPKARATYA